VTEPGSGERAGQPSGTLVVLRPRANGVATASFDTLCIVN